MTGTEFPTLEHEASPVPGPQSWVYCGLRPDKCLWPGPTRGPDSGGWAAAEHMWCLPRVSVSSGAPKGALTRAEVRLCFLGGVWPLPAQCPRAGPSEARPGYVRSRLFQREPVPTELSPQGVFFLLHQEGGAERRSRGRPEAETRSPRRRQSLRPGRVSLLMTVVVRRERPSSPTDGSAQHGPASSGFRDRGRGLGTMGTGPSMSKEDSYTVPSIKGGFIWDCCTEEGHWPSGSEDRWRERNWPRAVGWCGGCFVN